jgi:hypothetical protein
MPRALTTHITQVTLFECRYTDVTLNYEDQTACSALRVLAGGPGLPLTVVECRAALQTQTHPNKRIFPVGESPRP